MRKWIFVDYATMENNRPPKPPGYPTSRWGFQLPRGGIRPNSDWALREAPIIVTIDDGTLPMRPDGYPVKAAAKLRGTRCFKVVCESGNTHKNDNGHLVLFTDGRVKLDDGDWIE